MGFRILDSCLGFIGLPEIGVLNGFLLTCDGEGGRVLDQRLFYLLVRSGCSCRFMGSYKWGF